MRALLSLIVMLLLSAAWAAEDAASSLDVAHTAVGQTPEFQTKGEGQGRFCKDNKVDGQSYAELMNYSKEQIEKTKSNPSGGTK